MENGCKNSVVEALILASPEPLPARKIADVIVGMTPSRVGHVVAELNNRYMQAGCAFRIRELAGGYQFYVVPEFAGYVQELFARRRKMRLTRASLETLAIVAYRQPVTKSEIEHIRGVASDGVIHNLLEKKLVAIKGRAGTIGKPLQYGTTNEFLKFFGLASLSDLPRMSEIEELVKAGEPRGQTELKLDEAAALRDVAQKLNVADGTYDPQSREEHEEIDDELNEPASAQPSDRVRHNDQEPVNSPEIPPEEADKAAEKRQGVIVDMDATGELDP